MLKICINDVLVIIFKQIYSLKFNKSFIRISVILKQSINFLIGSGYFAGPGKIAPRSYFAGPGKIVPRGYFAGPGKIAILDL